MTSFFLWALFAISSMAHPTIWNVTATQGVSALQAVIDGSSAGDTVSFAAGTYSISSKLILKCGVTYTGPAKTPATAILASTFRESDSIFNLYSGAGYANPCTQATTIEYLNFQNSGGIYVQTSYTNLSILHNQFTNLPCCTAIYADWGIGIDGGSAKDNTSQTLTATTIEYNSFGDSDSCTSPINAMTDTTSPEDPYVGACGAMQVYSSVNGITFEYNNLYHVAEGVHLQCPNAEGQKFECEPPGGPVTKRITAEYNDFSNIHRITWEAQAQQSGGIVFAYNTEHDWFNPYFGSFGLSMACCYSGATQPYLNASDNVVLFNVSAGASGRYGYGMEAMGRGATYNNNLLQANNSRGNAPGIAYGCGPVASVTNNTVQGDFSPYIANEGITNCGTDSTPASLTGNVTGSTLSSAISVTPTISPAAGVVAFPLIVTFTDKGYTSGSLPLGNTGIWYTTDGTTPIPGSGSAQYLPSGGRFLLSSAATVKAVGMWGSRNQPTSYPIGFGYVPSPVVSAVFKGGSGSGLRSAYLVSKGGSTSIPLGRTLQFIAHGVYADGTSVVLPDSAGNVVTAWNTSNHALAKISSLGHVTAMGVGTVVIEGFIGNLKASTAELTITPSIDSSLQTAIEPTAAPFIKPPSEQVTAVPGSPIADKFLGPLWKVMTPNGGSASISNGHLLLSVPGGSNHDALLPTNQAVRVVQAIGDTDFNVSIKIDSQIQEIDADTSQGLMVLSDDGDSITFALTTDGTNIGLLARTVNAGVSTTVLEDTNFNQYQNPMYLRLARSGAAYVASYSGDGTHWTQATSFTDAGTFSFIGPFDSNYNESPEKTVPVAMSVDWFNVE